MYCVFSCDIMLLLFVSFSFLVTLCSMWDLRDQGSKLLSLQWKLNVLTTGKPGESHTFLFFFLLFSQQYLEFRRPYILKSLDFQLGLKSWNFWHFHQQQLSGKAKRQSPSPMRLKASNRPQSPLLPVVTRQVLLNHGPTWFQQTHLILSNFFKL